MIEGQFELDGYQFGSPTDDVVILTQGWDYGSYTVRDQDVPAPQGDHVFFGRDYHAPGVWTFTFGVRNQADPTNVYPVLARLAEVWRSSRLNPGQVSTLRYRRNGESRRVFGRPRNFAVEKDDVMDHEFKLVTATFQLMDANTYSDELKSVTLDLVSTSHEEGLIFPAETPWEFVSDGFVRKGMVTIAGNAPTPFKVTVRGPLDGRATNFRLSSTTGWVMNFQTYLSPRGNIVVDTTRGMVTRNGATFGSIKGRTDYLARLQPGAQEIIFEANDPTYTSTATIEWREISPTI